MAIKKTLKATGSLVDAFKTILEFADTQGLRAKIESDNLFQKSTVNEMKDTIKNTVGLQSLKRSTQEIRNQRRRGKGGKEAPSASNLTKPLVETGNLLKSIKQKKTKVSKNKIEFYVEMLDYGLLQASGFIVSSGNKFREGSCDGKRVPPRDFITKATKKGAEFLRENLIEIYREKVGKRRRLGQRTL